MLTGATPSVSGIIGNDWFDRETGTTVTSVSDPNVKLLGAADRRRRVAAPAAGQHGRRRAEDGVAAPKGHAGGAARLRRVAEGSIGDPAGRARGAMRPTGGTRRRGRFVTSTYYIARSAGVGAAFNERKLAGVHAGRVVDAAVAPPDHCLTQLPAEGGARALRRGLRQPVRQRAARSSSPSELPDARTAGRSARSTDLLSVSFSSNDSVGHTYGPDSPQVRDIAIRTDRTHRPPADPRRRPGRSAAHARSRSPPTTASRRCRKPCATAACRAAA